MVDQLVGPHAIDIPARDVDVELEKPGSANRVFQPRCKRDLVSSHLVEILRFDADARFSRRDADHQRTRLTQVFEPSRQILMAQCLRQLAHLANPGLIAPDELPIAHDRYRHISPLPMRNRLGHGEAAEFEILVRPGDIVGPLGQQSYFHGTRSLAIQTDFDVSAIGALSGRYA